MNKKQVNECLDAVNEAVDRLKTKYIDPIIMIGGDYNRKDLSTLTRASPELSPVAAGATRNGYALDEVYTNVGRSIVQKEILQPLCKEDGTKSDHLIVAASVSLPRNRRNTTRSFTFRPLTRKGTEVFKTLLLSTDWSIIKKRTSSESALALTELLNTYLDECFPVQTRKVKSNDTPWFNQKTRRLANKKLRIYKLEGKSERYKEANKAYIAELKVAKKAYLDKVIDKCKKDRNTKSYYKTVKVFQTKEAPKLWEIANLFPDKSEKEIAEEVAAFFNKISLELSLIHI